MRRLLLVVVAGCSHPHPAPAPEPEPTPAPADAAPIVDQFQASDEATFSAEQMCVTHGEMKGLHVADASMRAVARGSQGDAGAIDFTYDGPTKKVSKLASGDVREQLGLKLRAEDGCNLVYVVWRFGPKPQLVVQVKRNKGAHTNSECGTDGYETIKASKTAKVSRPDAGSHHVLAAKIDGDALVATIDGKVAWSGALPDYAADLHGPLGVRTDNVEATLSLSGPTTKRDDAERCKSRGAD